MSTYYLKRGFGETERPGKKAEGKMDGRNDGEER